MKKIYVLLFTFLMTTATTFGQVVINEIDADTPGTDTAEFIELFGTPNASLDGLVVVLFNGSSDTSYAAFDLDGNTLDANGFFILGNDSVISAGDISIGASNALQNGADAVAIYTGDDTDFPTGTAATTTNLVSAIVYDTNDGDDTGLLTALGETVQYNEDENAAKDSQSIQRKEDGTYEVKNPTFRLSNGAAVCSLAISVDSVVCDAITSGADTYTTIITFTGGGTETYTVNSTTGSVDLTNGNPTNDETGTIEITGVTEGTDVTLTITSTLCDLSEPIVSPSCIPALNLPFTEDFSYADGSLTANPNWSDYSGTPLDMLVSGGQAVVLQDGSRSEDAGIEFTPVSGDVYYSFDFTLNDPGAGITGTDFEYFASFKDDAFILNGRLDIVAPASGGDFSLGLATSASTADATWGSDLTFGTTYRVTVRYSQDNNIAELWVDASSATDTSITSSDEGAPGTTVSQFILRQSGSSSDETILVDNLTVATTFAETLSVQNIGALAEFSLYPNPTNTGSVNITSSNTSVMNVQVFDILGKQVKNETLVNDTLNVSNLKSGLYMVKITQDNATSTKKLVIK
jgi:hypothetical protein